MDIAEEPCVEVKSKTFKDKSSKSQEKTKFFKILASFSSNTTVFF